MLHALEVRAAGRIGGWAWPANAHHRRRQLGAAQKVPRISAFWSQRRTRAANALYTSLGMSRCSRLSLPHLRPDETALDPRKTRHCPRYLLPTWTRLTLAFLRGPTAGRRLTCRFRPMRWPVIRRFSAARQPEFARRARGIVGQVEVFATEGAVSRRAWHGSELAAYNAPDDRRRSARRLIGAKVTRSSMNAGTATVAGSTSATSSRFCRNRSCMWIWATSATSRRVLRSRAARSSSA